MNMAGGAFQMRRNPEDRELPQSNLTKSIKGLNILSFSC